MKNNKLALSIIAFIFVLILGGLLGYGYYQKANYKLKRPVVSMEIEGYGTVKIELYPDEAPNTVRNIIKLINEGYYNGQTFDDVEENLIQIEEKTVNEDETEICIDGEFTENGYDNNLKFERGTIGLKREDYTTEYYYYGLNESVITEGYNSGFATFFIATQDIKDFDGLYTSFGRVIEGMEIIDQISELETEVDTDEETGETSATTKPVNPPVIKTVTVDTFGENYGEPKTHEKFNINNAILQRLYGISY